MLLLKPFPGANTAPFALLFIGKPLELNVLRLVPTPVLVKVIEPTQEEVEIGRPFSEQYKGQRRKHGE